MGNIDWIDISELPEAFKDGRRLLLWHGETVVGRWAPSFSAAHYGDASPGWYNPELDRRANPTHFAEINPPTLKAQSP